MRGPRLNDALRGAQPEGANQRGAPTVHSRLIVQYILEAVNRAIICDMARTTLRWISIAVCVGALAVAVLGAQHASPTSAAASASAPKPLGAPWAPTSVEAQGLGGQDLAYCVEAHGLTMSAPPFDYPMHTTSALATAAIPPQPTSPSTVALVMVDVDANHAHPSLAPGAKWLVRYSALNAPTYVGPIGFSQRVVIHAYSFLIADDTGKVEILMTGC